MLYSCTQMTTVDVKGLKENLCKSVENNNLLLFLDSGHDIGRITAILYFVCAVYTLTVGGLFGLTNV